MFSTNTMYNAKYKFTAVQKMYGNPSRRICKWNTFFKKSEIKNIVKLLFCFHNAMSL